MLLLEGKEEQGDLDPDQALEKYSIIKENLSLLETEESYWHSRSLEKWLLEGDSNSSYFHKVANGRQRKNTIISLEKDGKIIEGDDNLLRHATEYYSELFGPEVEHNIHIDPSLWDGIVKVNESENEELCSPFSEEEIRKALFQMESNRAAGPDKISIEFYQKCWYIVKKDIIQLFDDFYKGVVDISRINYGSITLLPKVSDACRI